MQPTDDSAPTLAPKIQAGLNYLQAGKTQEARTLFEDVLAGNPDDYNALQLLGAIFVNEGDAKNGIPLIQKALAIKPNLFGAWNNLGCAHFAEENFVEAVNSFQRALQLKPDMASTRYNLGNAFFSAGRRRDATAQYYEAYRLKPDHTAALGLYVHCNALECSWSDVAAREALITAAANHVYAGPPFILQSLIDDAASHLSAARRHLARTVTKSAAPWSRALYADHQRIRIAYVSRDFNQSAVAHLIASLFEDHDRTRFEVYALSFGPDDGSALRRRLERAFDKFIDVRALSNAAAAQVMRDLEIDIAIDLTGHTHGSRIGIFSYRAAPIQVTYLGFTTGSDFFDYVIVDPFLVPQDQQVFHTETLFHLPDCFLPSDKHRAAAAHTPSREDCGLPKDGFVFCSFNNSYKITPVIFDIWMRLLNSVPGSVLWLASSNLEATENLEREASARGVRPERLVFAPKIGDMSEHLARYRLADLFLDTFPYNAGTTASDALSVGLPLLTLSGRTYASRMAGSLLHTLNLPELMTTSFAEYEARALRLATQPEALALVKTKLERARRESPLFDTDRFRRNLESIYQGMMEKWRARRESNP